MNERRDGRDLLLGTAHVAVLWAFAMVQPLFDVLSDNAEFFVARGNTAADILLFSVGLTVLPPAATLAVEWAVGRFSPRLSRQIHLAFIAILGAALALQILETVFEKPAWLLVAAAAALGALAAFAYATRTFLRSALTFLSPAPALFLGLFLFFSPISDLIFPQEEVQAAAGTDVRSNAPVVMVLFDELPVASLLDGEGRIDASRYPNFAALARRSTWYPNATTIEPFSTAAIPAILSGQKPDADALPLAGDYPDSIFTLLGGSVRMNAYEAVTRVCPETLCPNAGSDESALERLGALTSDLSVVSGHVLLPQELSRGLPPVDQAFEGFRRDLPPGGSAQAQNQVAFEVRQVDREDRNADFESFLSSLDSRGRTLNFHHSLLPHVAWEYLPSGQLYWDQSTLDRYTAGTESRWAKNRWLVAQAWQRHLLQVGFVDRLLGRLVERMREIGIWKRALLVVAADHGISFLPEEHRRVPTEANLGGIAGIPLFIKEPRQRAGRIMRQPTCTTAIVPEIARALDAGPLYETEPCATQTVRVGPTEIAFSRFRDQREQMVTAMRRAFGAGSGWGPVLRHGPYDEIVGSRPRRLAAVPASDTRAWIVDADAYAAIDLAERLPALVQGTVTGPFDPGAPLAIVVNDRIAAVTRAFNLGGTGRFQAMVPPRTLRQGENAIDVFRVGRERGRITLEPLTG